MRANPSYVSEMKKAPRTPRLLGMLAMLVASFVPSGDAQIAIDEDFDDWSGSMPLWVDGEDVDAGLDLLQMQVTNDEEYLYVRFRVSEEVKLVDNLVPHNVRLYLDTDNDPTTGYVQQEGYGTELSIFFRDHLAWFDLPEPDVQVGFESFGLRIAPTVTADMFELAIRRDAVPNGVDPLFPGPTIRLLLKDAMGGDVLPNVGEVFSYTFDEGLASAWDPLDLARPTSTDLRVVTYNVHQNGGWSSSADLPMLSRVVGASDADVFAFQECNGASAAEVKAYLDEWLPGEQEWDVRKHGDMVTASKWPIESSWNLWKKQAVLIQSPEDTSRHALVINAHLTCCANDANRQAQVDEMVAFVRDAKTPGGEVDLAEGTPILFVGDMNFVGYRQQVLTSITGDIQDEGTYGPDVAMDWDGSDLADVRPMQADDNMNYTWRDDALGTYPPGRLDFQFCTDAVLNVVHAFVLKTETMPPDRLAQWGLNASDTDGVSDHLPVVVDYAWPALNLSDADGDGVEDDWDNCIDVPNANQSDWNGDGWGDVCQDSDGDGLSDAFELEVVGTDPSMMDSDGDGCGDGVQFGNGCNNANPTCAGDVDGDGVVGVQDLLVVLSNFAATCE